MENCKDVDVINPRDENKLAYVTQTTLSIDDTLEIGNALKTDFLYCGSTQRRYLLCHH